METEQNNSSFTAHGLIKLDYYNEDSKHYIQFTQGNVKKTTEGIQIFVPNDSVKYLAFIEYEKFDILFEINKSAEVTNNEDVKEIKKESLDKAADPLSYVGSRSKIKEENHSDVAENTEIGYLYLDVKFDDGSDDGIDDLPLQNLITHDGSEKNDIDSLKTENIQRRNEQNKYKDSFGVSTKGTNNVCKVCNTQFSSHNEVVKHYKSSHSNRRSQNVKKICKSSKVGSTNENVPAENKVSGKETILVDGTSKKDDDNNTDGNQKRFKCDLCDARYRKEGCLKNHRLKHGKAEHKCDLCTESFKTYKELKEHAYSIHEHEEKKFECDKCPKKFHLKAECIKHKSLHVKERPHQCEKCPKSFLCRADLKSHQQVHTGIKPFECHICHNKFYRSCNLASHLSRHDEDKKIQCDICGRKFFGTQTFKMHRISHTQEKPFACDICKKTFATKFKVTQHYRIHTGEKPYKCKVCFEKFAQRESLRLHFRVNHEDGKNVCSVCGKSFPILSKLNVHKKIHNENSKIHCCPHCDMRFVDNHHLKRHLMVHTGETPYECSQCGKKFTQRSNMRSHMKVHTK